MERVTRYTEAGDGERALEVCREAMHVWRQSESSELMAETLEMFEEVVASLQAQNMLGMVHHVAEY